MSVIITHAGSICKLTGFTRSMTNIGGFGVQLFFVISAFTIFYSLSKSDGKKFQMRDFFIKRLFRIIPVYWLGIILYTVIYGNGSRGWRDAPELWHYPVHIFLLNVLYPTTSSSVVPGGWSISCEVLFYLSVPLLYTYLKTKKRIILFMIAAVVIWPIISYFLAKSISPLLFPGIEANLIRNFWYRWLPNQLGCFGFGIILFYLFKHKEKYQFLSIKKYNAILLTCLIIGIPVIILKAPPAIAHYVYACVFMLIGLLLSFVNWKLIVNKFTVFVGKISFSCYLLHFIVLQKGFEYLTLYVPLTNFNKMYIFFGMVVFAYAVTFPLAYLSFKLVEQNATELGHRLIKSLNKRIEMKEGRKSIQPVS